MSARVWNYSPEFPATVITGDMQALVLDLECSSLNASFGRLLAAGWQWADQPEVKVAVRSYKTSTWNDKEVIKAISDEIEKADVLITHNGRRFDLPFLYTRIIAHGMPVLPNTPLIDTYQIARSWLRPSSRRLDAIGTLLQLPQTKTPLDPDVWAKAAGGDRESLDVIADHCAADVSLTTAVYGRLRSLMRTHPRIGGWDRSLCRYCGGGPLQRRKRILTTLNPRIQMQCQSCGAYETRPETVGERRGA